MGSGNLVVIDANGNRMAGQPALPLGEGPTGLALDEPRERLYVLNRFAESISVVDTRTATVAATVPLFDPTPAVIKTGRKHLYDTHATSSLGQAACASCHVDGRFDRLAWDLGDPTGSIKLLNATNNNFGRFPPAVTNHFHPMKGPMVTQTLQDIIGHEPFHWRGDRDGLEQFNITLTNLQGAASALTTNEMRELKDFLASITFPPNPYRQFNNSLSTNCPGPRRARGGATAAERQRTSRPEPISTRGRRRLYALSHIAVGRRSGPDVDGDAVETISHRRKWATSCGVHCASAVVQTAVQDFATQEFV